MKKKRLFDEKEESFYAGYEVGFKAARGMPDRGLIPIRGQDLTAQQIRQAKAWNAKAKKVRQEIRKACGLSAADLKKYNL